MSAPTPEEMKAVLGLAVATSDGPLAARLMNAGAKPTSAHLAMALRGGPAGLCALLRRGGAEMDAECVLAVLRRDVPGDFAAALMPSVKSLPGGVEVLMEACRVIEAPAVAATDSRRALAEALFAAASHGRKDGFIWRCAFEGRPRAIAALARAGADVESKGRIGGMRAIADQESAPLEAAFALAAHARHEGRDASLHEACVFALLDAGAVPALRAGRLRKREGDYHYTARSVPSLENLLDACEAAKWEAGAMRAAEAAGWPERLEAKASRWPSLASVVDRLALGNLLPGRAKPGSKRGRAKAL